MKWAVLVLSAAGAIGSVGCCWRQQQPYAGYPPAGYPSASYAPPYVAAPPPCQPMMQQPACMPVQAAPACSCY